MKEANKQSPTASDRSFPIDLFSAVILLGFSALVLFVPTLRESVIRFIALPILLFLPGYAIVAALFPRINRTKSNQAAVSDRDGIAETWINGETIDGITGIERCAVAHLASVAIIAFIALTVSVSMLPFSSYWLFVGIAIVTLVGLGTAYRRRTGLSPAERCNNNWGQYINNAYTKLSPNTLREVVMLVIVILSIAVAAGTLGSTAMTSGNDGSTELYLLTEDEDELVADEYPDEIVAGESESLQYGVENYDHETRKYTVVVQLQQIENGSEEITSQEELHRQSLTLDYGETTRQEHTVEPTHDGNTQRLVYLLYRGSPPSEPSIENAYRSVHVWINK